MGKGYQFGSLVSIIILSVASSTFPYISMRFVQLSDVVGNEFLLKREEEKVKKVKRSIDVIVNLSQHVASGEDI